MHEKKTDDGAFLMLSKEKCFTCNVFPVFAILISQEIFLIHVIRQHVKHDTIAIYFSPAHEHLQIWEIATRRGNATQGHRYVVFDSFVLSV